MMHMENRIGIKILTMLLSEGLLHAKGGTRLFQRRILWLSGLAEKHLASLRDRRVVTEVHNTEVGKDDINEYSFTDI